jgi:hypothetical protein
MNIILISIPCRVERPSQQAPFSFFMLEQPITSNDPTFVHMSGFRYEGGTNQLFASNGDNLMTLASVVNSSCVQCLVPSSVKEGTVNVTLTLNSLERAWGGANVHIRYAASEFTLLEQRFHGDDAATHVVAMSAVGENDTTKTGAGWMSSSHT